MSEVPAPNTDFRFNSQEFLGYQPSDQPIRPSLTMADVAGTLWRLLYTHWLAIAVTCVFGCLLPNFVLEQVFSIEILNLDYDVLKSDFYGSFWTLAVSAWGSLAMALLIKQILSAELGRSFEWQDTLLAVVPIVALSAILWVGLMIGVLLLVIPGVIFYLATILALPILLMEGKSIRDAIRQSFHMTRGFRGKIFWISVGLYFLGAVVTLAFGSLIQALGQVGEQLVTSEQIGRFLEQMGSLPDALLASALYLSIQKSLRVDEPDKLASVFD